MAILRTIPVNLLTVPAAVAERLAPLAELAGVRIQFNGADSTVRSYFAKCQADGIHVLLPSRATIVSSPFGDGPPKPHLGPIRNRFDESAALHGYIGRKIIALQRSRS